MVIVPSIDVRGGRVVARGAVRVPPGGATDLTPSQLASRYVADGAEELHLVDLDAADPGPLGRVTGPPGRIRSDHANLALLAAIARSCGVPARLAGGISSVTLAREALEAGFAGVLFSSAVFGDDDLLREIARLGERAIVEIEAWVPPGGSRVPPGGSRVPPGGLTDGWLAPRGGDPALVEAARGRGALAAARAAVDRGVRHLYVIDLGAEGRVTGPALALLEELRSSLGAHGQHVRIHTGGGIGTLDDVRALARWGAASAVIGRALLEGRFTIAEAKAAAL